MQIVVVGAGRVGFAIAEKLSLEQHNVVVIDKSEESLKAIDEALDVLTIEGEGASGRTLEQAQIFNTDLFIAVTNQDEVNLVACQLARYYGVSKKIARIGNMNFLPTDGGLKPEDLGVDLVINPEEVCAREIVRLLRTHAVSESQEFVDGRVALIGILAGFSNPLVGKQLSSFQKDDPMRQVRLVAIAREGETIIPRGGTRVEHSDQLYFMCAKEKLEGLYEFLRLDNRPLDRALIVGGGEIGALAAAQLEEMKVDVNLLEWNVERAEDLSESLQSTMVFRGDATSLKELKNAGLENVDGFLAACGDDEVNILSCLMAHQYGARKTLAVIRKPEYLPLLSSLKGVDGVVSPRLVTASAILRFVRRGKIHAAVAVRDIEAEVIEIEVQARSKVTDKRIMDIPFPKDAVMGCIVRGKSVLPAEGQQLLREEDRVVVLAKSGAIRDVEKMFEKKSRGLIF
jgi:trk system potassium uptake protein